jgi:HlyD family secretion protein
VDEDAFRKICVGQDVVISFIGYPHRQYGNLEGKVKSLTEIPTKDRYLVKIDLPFGLKTSKKRNIKYDIGMIGNAEIVLQNQRLIEKVLRRVK